jgi:hypothetical protein
MSVPYGSDPWLDARLRNVPLPPGMLARLNEVAEETAVELSIHTGDGEEAKRLNRPMPVGPGFTDVQMDGVLLDVAVPAGLIQRLERIVYEPRRSFPVRYYAAAAAVILAVGISYLGRLGYLAVQGGGGTNNPAAIAAIEKQGNELVPALGTDETGASTAIAASESAVSDGVVDPAIEELRWQLIHEATLFLSPLGFVTGLLFMRERGRLNLQRGSPVIFLPRRHRRAVRIRHRFLHRGGLPIPCRSLRRSGAGKWRAGFCLRPRRATTYDSGPNMD